MSPRRSPIFDPSEWPIAWMARAERQHARNANALLVPLGLPHREFRLLAFIGSAKSIEIGELAERAVLERPTVSKMIERLVAAGWVDRGAHADDRRRTPLSLTAAGQAKLAQAAPVVRSLFKRYQAGRTPAQAEHFMAALRDFFARVRDAQAGQREP